MEKRCDIRIAKGSVKRQCQTSIAEKIVDREAEYVLALKENQGHLYEDVERLFADLEGSQYKAYGFDYDKTVNKDHGRIEMRE